MFYFVTCTECEGTGKQRAHKKQLLNCSHCNAKGYVEVDQSTYELFDNEQIENRSIGEAVGENISSAFFTAKNR